MNASLLFLVVFGCVFGAGFLATRLRLAMPDHHLSTDTKDTVKLAMGLVATMTALVLGLLVASAKGNYDSEKSAVISMSAKFVVLDRILAHYGPEAKPSRDLLHQSVEKLIAHLWPDKKSEPSQLDPTRSSGEALYDAMQSLAPRDDSQRLLKSQALGVALDLGQMRWLMFEQSGSSISGPLLTVVVCWLAILFFSFGLFAPPNGTARIALLVAALSVSSAIFLILELDQPFDGFIHISSRPMQTAVNHLGK
jgi:hypothetical protein